MCHYLSPCLYVSASVCLSLCAWVCALYRVFYLSLCSWVWSSICLSLFACVSSFVWLCVCFISPSVSLSLSLCAGWSKRLFACFCVWTLSVCQCFGSLCAGGSDRLFACLCVPLCVYESFRLSQLLYDERLFSRLCLHACVSDFLCFVCDSVSLCLCVLASVSLSLRAFVADLGLMCLFVSLGACVPKLMFYLCLFASNCVSLHYCVFDFLFCMYFFSLCACVSGHLFVYFCVPVCLIFAVLSLSVARFLFARLCVLMHTFVWFCLFLGLRISVYVCLSPCVPMSYFVYLCVCLFFTLSLSLSLSLSFSLSLSVSACLSICLPVSVCRSQRQEFGKILPFSFKPW